tara:strand:- start:70 stop:249 length:180 start_codon:yes stop_codon:yes gene_type:complete
MSADVVPLFGDADKLWEEYRRLAAMAGRDMSLWSDRSHCEAMALAHERWRRAFIATEAV